MSTNVVTEHRSILRPIIKVFRSLFSHIRIMIVEDNRDEKKCCPPIGGAIRSSDSDDDLLYETIAKVASHHKTVPTAFVISDYSISCREQGNQGTCAAFVASAIKEIQLIQSLTNPKCVSPSRSKRFENEHPNSVKSEPIFHQEKPSEVPRIEIESDHITRRKSSDELIGLKISGLIAQGVPDILSKPAKFIRSSSGDKKDKVDHPEKKDTLDHSNKPTEKSSSIVDKKTKRDKLKKSNNLRKSKELQVPQRDTVPPINLKKCATTLSEATEATLISSMSYMSPKFIYDHRSNKPMEGMSGKDALRILKDIGTVPENMYPYEASTSLDDKLYAVAENYRIGGYAKVISYMGLKNAILDLLPGYILLPAYNSEPQFWRKPYDGAHHVGHAITVVGYTEEGFSLRNSWGPTWNGNGHTILPYEDWHLVWECWVAIDNVKPKSPRKKSMTIGPTNRNASPKIKSRKKHFSLTS